MKHQFKVVFVLMGIMGLMGTDAGAKNEVRGRHKDYCGFLNYEPVLRPNNDSSPDAAGIQKSFSVALEKLLKQDLLKHGLLTRESACEVKLTKNKNNTVIGRQQLSMPAGAYQDDFKIPVSEAQIWFRLGRKLNDSEKSRAQELILKGYDEVKKNF